MHRTVAVVLLAACASSKPPAQSAPIPVSASRDVVWSTALSTLADRSIPVKTSDKTSGLITTEEVMIPASDNKQAGACGTGLIKGRPGRAQYTILVSGDSTPTLRVSSRLTWYNIYGSMIGECVSTGFLEGRLQEAIRERANGH